MGNNFIYEYGQFNTTDKNTFSRVCNKLLNETFLVKSKETDKNDYYFVIENFKLINDYLKYIEYECVKDESLGVIRLISIVDRNKVKFKKFDTVLILVLRLLYYKQSKTTSNIDKIYTTLEEVDFEMKSTQIFDAEKRYDKNYEDSLRNLKKYKIVDYFDKFSMEMTIEILPTILLVIENSLSELQQMINEFSNSTKKEEDIDEGIKED